MRLETPLLSVPGDDCAAAVTIGSVPPVSRVDNQELLSKRAHDIKSGAYGASEAHSGWESTTKNPHPTPKTPKKPHASRYVCVPRVWDLSKLEVVWDMGLGLCRAGRNRGQGAGWGGNSGFGEDAAGERGLGSRSSGREALTRSCRCRHCLREEGHGRGQELRPARGHDFTRCPAQLKGASG